MKTIRQVEVTPVFLEGFAPDWEEMKEAHIYISYQYHSALHLCLCGCKDKVVTPLNSEALPDHGWTITEDAQRRITMAPSIGNFQSACKLHYIITKNTANFV